MSGFIETLLARIWNKLATPRPIRRPATGIELGTQVLETNITGPRIFIPHHNRSQQIVIIGRTGSGKSSIIKSAAAQDVANDLGWIYFDLHGDADPFLLSVIAAEERRRREDLSHRLIRIAPGEPGYSVGLNVLEPRADQNAFVQIAEFTEILRKHWHLESFGAQTEELLRNSLHVLADNGYTLVELSPLLTNTAFRLQCIRHTRNAEIRQYFEGRFDAASPAMQATMRNPILNKVSFLTIDPHFRHLIGQRESTFDLLDAMDQGRWVILNLSKGQLGEQALTLGSLILAKLKNSLFARQRRSLFTVFCDELQNWVASDSGIETMLSESRKQSVGIVTATQYLDAVSPLMRAALLAVQTHVLFRLSGPDADKLAAALDGGRQLAGLLRSLPARQMVMQTGDEPWKQVLAKTLITPPADYADLLRRSRQRWARPRREIERDIQGRQPAAVQQQPRRVPDEWA